MANNLGNAEHMKFVCVGCIHVFLLFCLALTGLEYGGVPGGGVSKPSHSYRKHSSSWPTDHDLCDPPRHRTLTVPCPPLYSSPDTQKK